MLQQHNRKGNWPEIQLRFLVRFSEAHLATLVKDFRGHPWCCWALGYYDFWTFYRQNYDLDPQAYNTCAAVELKVNINSPDCQLDT